MRGPPANAAGKWTAPLIAPDMRNASSITSTPLASDRPDNNNVASAQRAGTNF